MISRKFNGLANIVGKKIEILRKQRGWSRADLSNKLMILGIDINYDSIYKIEKGKRIVKDFELAAFSIVLNTNETDLLYDFRQQLK